jgi:hypothetical protein
MLGAELSFGQPTGGLIQLGYTVPDLAHAMKTFTATMGAGPWFVLRNFAGVDPLYRGEASHAVSDIALGFAGHLQIELIQPKDDHPSVFREKILERGHGFHHFGIAAADLDALKVEHLARGYDIAFTAAVPTGGRVIYFDTHGEMPGMLELIEADAALNAMFGAMHAASEGWDGTEPVRGLG